MNNKLKLMEEIMGIKLSVMAQYLFLFTLSFSLLTSCGGEKIESQKRESKLKIDGNSDDWENYNQFLYDDWKVIYSIINNDSSLSLMFQFRNPQLAMKINMRGLTLWINSEGDNEKLAGIRYENRKLMDQIINDLADGNGMQPGKLGNSSIDLTGTFSLIDKEGYIISDLDQSGIQAALQKNQGNYCFEYNIIPTAENGLVLSEDTDLKIGIEISAVSDEFKEILEENWEVRMQGGMSGGMRGGGRRGGGMGGSRGGTRENMTKDMDAQEIWFSVKLAK